MCRVMVLDNLVQAQAPEQQNPLHVSRQNNGALLCGESDS